MTGIDDLKIIEGVIQSYLDGLYEGDDGKIASVFHPTSALTSVTNDASWKSRPVTSGWTRSERVLQWLRPDGKTRYNHQRETAVRVHRRQACSSPPRPECRFKYAPSIAQAGSGRRR